MKFRVCLSLSGCGDMSAFCVIFKFFLWLTWWLIINAKKYIHTMIKAKQRWFPFLKSRCAKVKITWWYAEQFVWKHQTSLFVYFSIFKFWNSKQINMDSTFRLLKGDNFVQRWYFFLFCSCLRYVMTCNFFNFLFYNPLRMVKKFAVNFL